MTHRDLRTNPTNPLDPAHKQRAKQAATRLAIAEEVAAAAALLNAPAETQRSAARELADALSVAEEWNVVGRPI